MDLILYDCGRVGAGACEMQYGTEQSWPEQSIESCPTRADLIIRRKKCNVAVPLGLPGQLQGRFPRVIPRFMFPLHLGDEEQAMAGAGWLDVRSSIQFSLGHAIGVTASFAPLAMISSSMKGLCSNCSRCDRYTSHTSTLSMVILER